ncbi:MAG: hypothetical protein J7L37_03590 [Thermococcus sp.]|nr:hypothetical protein [Thermococcus sp.]
MPTEVGYDFLIGLLTGLARDGIGGAHTNHVMSRFHSILKEIGEEVGEIRGLDEIRPLEDVTYRGRGKGIIVPRFKEFLQKHREKVIEEMTDAIYTAYKMRGKIIDKEKIRKAVENAIEISDKLAHNIFDNRADPYWIAVNHYKNLYDRPPAVQLTGVFDGLLRVPREKVLETIGDHIIELKKALPNVVKPEEVYGDLWYEFLKKKGIDARAFEARKSENPAPAKKLRRPSSELIAIAKALEYAGFSGEAMKRAEEDLFNRLDELLENIEENALEIAYTVKLLRLVQRGDVKGIREFTK